MAAASLVAPEWAVRRLRDRRRAHLPADWLEEAEAWLAPLRTDEADDVTEAGEAAPLALAGPSLPAPPVTL